MHIYAFGSLCRGEFTHNSDIDLLVCSDEKNTQYDVNKFSVYRYNRLLEMWDEGNPFSWHLHLESKMVFSSDGQDFLYNLGEPKKYKNIGYDLNKFEMLFENSYNQIINQSNSDVFHLSCMFLAIRNFATCYSLFLGKPVFSRNSPLLIEPSLNICSDAFATLVKARILSTRGVGDQLSGEEIKNAQHACADVLDWMKKLKDGVV